MYAVSNITLLTFQLLRVVDCPHILPHRRLWCHGLESRVYIRPARDVDQHVRSLISVNASSPPHTLTLLLGQNGLRGNSIGNSIELERIFPQVHITLYG